jgi:hypothetical protein
MFYFCGCQLWQFSLILRHLFWNLCILCTQSDIAEPYLSESYFKMNIIIIWYMINATCSRNFHHEKHQILITPLLHKAKWLVSLLSCLIPGKWNLGMVIRTPWNTAILERLRVAHEILLLLIDLRVHFYIHKILSLDTILSQLNSVKPSNTLTLFV